MATVTHPMLADQVSEPQAPFHAGRSLGRPHPTTSRDEEIQFRLGSGGPGSSFSSLPRRETLAISRTCLSSGTPARTLL